MSYGLIYLLLGIWLTLIAIDIVHPNWVSNNIKAALDVDKGNGD